MAWSCLEFFTIIQILENYTGKLKKNTKMAYEFNSLEEILRMIDKLVGFTEEQIKLIKSISESSFSCQHRYDE